MRTCDSSSPGVDPSISPHTGAIPGKGSKGLPFEIFLFILGGLDAKWCYLWQIFELVYIEKILII